MSQSYTGSRRYTGPILKKAKSLNFFSILEGKTGKFKTNTVDNAFPRKSKKRRKTKSNFAKENEQVQKICYLYGISKKQLKNSFLQTKDKEGTKEYNLYLNFELRLDNTLFLSGFGTRRFARQIVNHDHLKVNGKRVNIPSYKLKVNDCIELSDKIYKNKILKTFIDRNYKSPDYLKVEGKKITLQRIPSQEELTKKEIDMSLVIRKCSREV